MHNKSRLDMQWVNKLRPGFCYVHEAFSEIVALVWNITLTWLHFLWILSCHFNIWRNLVRGLDCQGCLMEMESFWAVQAVLYKFGRTENMWSNPLQTSGLQFVLQWSQFVQNVSSTILIYVALGSLLLALLVSSCLHVGLSVGFSSM